MLYVQLADLEIGVVSDRTWAFGIEKDVPCSRYYSISDRYHNDVAFSGGSRYHRVIVRDLRRLLTIVLGCPARGIDGGDAVRYSFRPFPIPSAHVIYSIVVCYFSVPLLQQSEHNPTRRGGYK